jgi:hypothetical protein
MALPTKEKTWLHTVNQTVGANVSAQADARDYVFKLKQSLIGFGTNPWTVWGSSDGTSFDNGGGTDYWTTQTDLTWNWPGSAHSWIVLKQAGIGANFSLCIDLDQNPTTSTQWSLVVSLATGFNADGTLTDRPTATEGYTYGTVEHGGTSGAWTGKLHVMQSNDGECTRWILCKGGSTHSFGFFDKVKNPVAAWTNPGLHGYLPCT